VRTLLVVPAYNEEASLPATLAELAREAPGLDVVVVDDGSRDRTARVARAAGVPVLVLPVNLGVGGALQTGFRYALERSYDAGVQFDADGQHDPRDLPGLLAPLAEGRADLVIGSRFIAGRGGYRPPRLRGAGMALFSGLTSLAVGRRLTDTTSGLRAYGRRVMRLCLEYFPQDFPDAPLLIWLARRGVRWVEVPATMRARRGGASFYTFAKSAYYPYKTLLASLIAMLRAGPREGGSAP
jgi:glycosyltransferase involved in cell wall biosynthesis